MTPTRLLRSPAGGSRDCEHLTLAFSPSNAPLRDRWRNNGLSADFLGDYAITFLPANGGADGVESRQIEIKHAVTYIANELLENAMKYHERNVEVPIGIHLELAGDHITVSVSNCVGAAQLRRYRAFVDEIQGGEAADLLLKRQQANGQRAGGATSCLGLLTMISDYDAQLGWQFEIHPMESELATVTTSAVLPLKIFPGVSA